MTYAKKLQEILSDGRWHCVLDMISETGLSARNRISEMNLKHLEEKGYEKNLDDWNNLNAEDRKKQIDDMLKKAGIR